MAFSPQVAWDWSLVVTAGGFLTCSVLWPQHCGQPRGLQGQLGQPGLEGTAAGFNLMTEKHLAAEGWGGDASLLLDTEGLPAGFLGQKPLR